MAYILPPPVVPGGTSLPDVAAASAAGAAAATSAKPYSPPSWLTSGWAMLIAFGVSLLFADSRFGAAVVAMLAVLFVYNLIQIFSGKK